MTRPSLETLDLPTVSGPPSGGDRAAWLHACFAPEASLLDMPTAEEGDGPGWHALAFWWPSSAGVQLVLLPCRSRLQ